MKKPLALLIVTASISLALTACGGNEQKETESQTESIVSTVEETVVETETVKETESAVPGIKGSQAYDVIISLEGNGIPKAKTVNTDDGFQYDSNNASYSYSISANSNHEIMSATFIVLDGEDTEGYLQYCASLPYDLAESENASKWVMENIGTDAQTTFGDAVFTLSVGNQGPVLNIKAPDFDDYVLEKAMQ